MTNPKEHDAMPTEPQSLVSEEEAYAIRAREINALADATDSKDKPKNKSWNALPANVRKIVVDTIVVVEDMTDQESIFDRADQEGVSFLVKKHDNVENPLNSTFANYSARQMYRSMRSVPEGSPQHERDAEARAMDTIKLELIKKMIHTRVHESVSAGNIPPGKGVTFGHTASAMSLATAYKRSVGPKA